MRKHELTSIVFAVLMAFAPSSAQAQANADCATQQRKELVVTVVDHNHAFIDSLRPGHFELKIGKTNAKITDVEYHLNEQPLDIVFLIDASVSQEKVLPLAQTIAKTFISSLVRTSTNRVAVASFSNKLNYKPVLTSDFDAAKVAIDEIKVDAPPGYVGGGVVIGTSPPRKLDVPGSTSLWDVIQSITQTLFSVNAEKRHRVMLLFTDGNDTSSNSKFEKVIEDAVKHDMRVFSIGLTDSINSDVNEGSLKKLSESTGGIARFPKNKEAVETTVDAIAQQLGAYYVITYCAGVNDRGKIRLEITHPELRKIKPILAYKRF